MLTDIGISDAVGVRVQVFIDCTDIVLNLEWDLGEPVDEYSFYETYWGVDKALWRKPFYREALERAIGARFNGEVFAIR